MQMRMFCGRMQMSRKKKTKKKTYIDADGWIADVLHVDVDVLHADADE